MLFLEYLFFKYYNWAVKVGDGDIPSITSVFCIAFGIMLYVIDITMVMLFFILPKISFKLSKYFFIIVGAIVFVVLYIMLVIKGKDEKIMEKHKEEWTGKKHLGAILFPIIAFVWFNVNWIIKMLMNQGKL